MTIGSVSEQKLHHVERNEPVASIPLRTKRGEAGSKGYRNGLLDAESLEDIGRLILGYCV